MNVESFFISKQAYTVIMQYFAYMPSRMDVVACGELAII